MVAHLLQAQHGGEHEPLALDALRAGDLLQHLVHHRLVEARLLSRERAPLRRLQLVRQVRHDRTVGLRAAEHERAREGQEPLGGVLVSVALDRDSELLPERALRPEQSGVQHLHDRPQLAEVVLDGRTRQRDAARRGDRAHGPRPARGRVLHLLCLVEHEARPGHRREHGPVSLDEGVARDDHVGASRLTTQRLPPRPRRAVVDDHRQPGREPLDLPAPVAHHRSRAHHEGRAANGALLPVGLEHAEHRRGLAEPHVVGEARTQPDPFEEPDPRHPEPLVRAKLAAEALGGRTGLERLGELAPQQRTERASGVHGHDWHPGLGDPSASHRTQDAREVHGPPPPPDGEELDQTPDLFGVQLRPLPADADQRGFQLGEAPEVGEPETDVTERGLPVELRETAGCQAAGGGARTGGRH